jgi:LysM repeat protein
MELRGRSDLARYAAPVAFLVAITILVVLVHSALSSGGGDTTTAAQSPTTTHRTTTHATTTKHAATTTSSTATTSTTPAGAQYYTIQSGDTFGSIAAAQGTTIGALEQLNPDVNPNALSVGQQIRIK